MTIFYIAATAILTALGSVFWMIWKESSAPADLLLHDTQKSDDNITAAVLLERLGMEKNTADPSHSKNTSKKFFKKIFAAGKEKAMISPAPDDKHSITPAAPPQQHLAPESGTAGLRLDSLPGKTAAIDVELAMKNDELQKDNTALQEKSRNMDHLLAEKNAALEKIKSELEQEKKHRKEFNKIKDLLEKEIKETKSSLKQAEHTLQSARAENQALNNRILQLEDKLKRFEKKSLEQDSRSETLKQNPDGHDTKDKALAPDTAAASRPLDQTTEPVNTLDDNASTDPTDSAVKTAPLEKEGSSSTSSINPSIPPENTNGSPATETAAQPEPEAFSSLLDLTPVSSLEHSYETDAAPKRPPAESAPDPHRRDTDQKEGGHQPEEKILDAFLNEHRDSVLNQNTDSPAIKENVTQPSATPEAGKSLKDPESSKKAADIFSDLYEENPEAELQEPQSPENLSYPEDEPQLEEESETETENTKGFMPASQKDRARLAPDIFQDIEEQFKKIQDEMSPTQEKQNIETDPENTSEEPDQNP